MQKALDLLRNLGWSLIDFIYSLIDSLFNILKEINAFDIVDSLSSEGVFVKFYTNIIVIAVTYCETILSPIVISLDLKADAAKPLKFVDRLLL